MESVKDSISFWMTVGGFVVGLVGIIVGIYFGVESNRLLMARRKFDWSDLLNAAKDLGRRINKEFAPDIIITPGLRGATVANILKSELTETLPVFVGISVWKEDLIKRPEFPGYYYLETSKWHVYIPEIVLNFKDKKVLVVDDFSMSGDFMQILTKSLIAKGFLEKNVKGMCVVATKVSIQGKKAPDFYWFESEDANFYFPWGKAR